MHVLIHGNLCPLQAQARISRVKCHLWHTDHHTTLCIYLYQMKEFFFFFNPVGTRTACQIWFLNVLLSCSWFMFAFFFSSPPPTTEQHGAVFTAMMGFESYRLNSISKSFPLKHNEAQRSTLQKARCLILWVAKYANLNCAAHQHLFAKQGRKRRSCAC